MFKLSGRVFTVLHAFTNSQTDGRHPDVLTADAHGDMFGAASGQMFGVVGVGIIKVTPAGAVSAFATPTYGVYGSLTIDRLGNIYDVGQDNVFKVSPTGTFTLLQVSSTRLPCAAVRPRRLTRGFRHPCSSTRMEMCSGERRPGARTATAWCSRSHNREVDERGIVQ